MKILVINNSAKDEQYQTREMQNIQGQNRETASRICLLKHLLYFHTVQLIMSSEEKVSARTFRRQKLRGKK